jgi:hypothetical protein
MALFKLNGNAKILQPGLLDVTQNYCEMVRADSVANTMLRNILDNFAKGYFEIAQKLLIPCPISVSG